MPPSRVVIRDQPYNAETPLAEQDGDLTATGLHYVRNHFGQPRHPGSLMIDGAVRRATKLTVNDLRARPTATAHVTLECAGNGRQFLAPPAPGEAWGLGAVSTAEWSGVLLADLLAQAGPAPDAVEVLFEGADSGVPGNLDQVMAFQRSLPWPLPPDLEGSVLVAHSMNGQSLPAEHGAPIRLVVPGWYGMASVKWLTRVSLVREPFRGFFQADRYVVDGRPIGRIAPRAVVVAPGDGGRLAAGREIEIRGYAWSGDGPIERVVVSVDGGATWTDAALGDRGSPTAWRSWHLAWTPPVPGVATILGRAIDATGNVQPIDQVWNEARLWQQRGAARDAHRRIGRETPPLRRRRLRGPVAATIVTAEPVGRSGWCGPRETPNRTGRTGSSRCRRRRPRRPHRGAAR